MHYYFSTYCERNKFENCMIFCNYFDEDLRINVDKIHFEIRQNRVAIHTYLID